MTTHAEDSTIESSATDKERNMNTFTINASNSFKFISSVAANPEEVFTAFMDWYETGYIVIDSKNRSFILSEEAVESRLNDGTFKMVDDTSAW